ncbi:MAG: M20/M25/M40 family metallo-hydrolase [Planctomycetes bacterium]|nr:M20/M25/M40 family metallo-hydrolase [Planctomycetota bacterium]
MDTPTRPATPGRPLAAFLVASALLFAAAPLLRALTRPPRALPADAPAEVASAARARAFHERVFDARTPHPVGSAEHARVRERLVAELERLGLAPVVEEHTVLRGNVLARVRNVVVPDARSARSRERGAGRIPAPGAVLLCAHYDSVAAGPGAGDDGAGVAALLEVARALQTIDEPLARPVRILFDDGEEMGLLGAQAFVEESAYRGDVAVVVNVEARGTRGASRMFETSAGNAELVAACAALPHPSASSVSVEVYRRMPNDTDLTVFQAAGLPGINFAFVGGGRHYHTRLDDREHLDLDALQHHAENALAVTRALAARVEPISMPGAAGDAVYADVAGAFLVRWPAWMAPWIAALLLGAVLLAARRSTRERSARWSELARGAGIMLASLTFAAGLALALDALVTSGRSGVYPWPPESAAARAAIALAGSAAVAWAAALLAPGERGLAARGLGLGVLLAHAVAGLAVAVFVPGASYAFALPLAAATAVVARPPARAALLLAFVSALFWLPFLAGLEEVFELRTRTLPACAALAAGSAWCAAPLAMLLAPASRRARVAVALGTTALALASTILALAEPERRADEPEPTFLAHVERAGEARAKVGVRDLGARDLAAWLDARGFGAAAENPFPWWPRSGRLRSADAPRLGLEPPRADVRAAWDGTTEGCGFANEERVVRLALASPRAARIVALELPKGVTARVLRDARGERKELHLRGSLTLIGFGTEEVVVGLGVRGAEPVALDVLDVDACDAGALGELRRALPLGFEPHGEGAVGVAARRAEL